MSKSIIPMFATSLLLIACDASSTTDGTQAGAADNSASSEQAVPLAAPQPYKPKCSVCLPGFGLATVANDDELSMTLNEEFVGLIEDVYFIEYSQIPGGTMTIAYHYFTQSVIDDLNDPETTETVVVMHFPNLVAGELVFKVDGVESTGPITMD